MYEKYACADCDYFCEVGDTKECRLNPVPVPLDEEERELGCGQHNVRQQDIFESRLELLTDALEELLPDPDAD